MDTILKCPVCFDYFDTTLMVIQCSHNFCALCIRKHLTYQNKCPVCNTNTVESDLKCNRLVDDIVAAYQQFKNQSENFTPERLPQYNTAGRLPQHNTVGRLPQYNTAGRLTRRNKVVSETSFTQLKNQNKEKTNIQVTRSALRPTTSNAAAIEISDDEENVTCTSVDGASHDSVAKRAVRYVRRTDDQTAPYSTETETTVNELLDNNNGLTITIPQSPGSDAAEGDDSLSPSRNSADDKVSCPVCGVFMKQQNVNLHLDSCLSSVEKKSSLRRHTPKRKCMAKLVYSIMSEKELRKKLKDIGLSSKGDKQMLVKRHHEFTILYNAECDSLDPRPVADVIKEFERTEKAKEEKGSSLFAKTQKLIISKNSSPDSIMKAQKSYEKHHKTQFDSLIQQTKSRMKKGHRKSARKIMSSSCSGDSLDVDSTNIDPKEDSVDAGSEQFDSVNQEICSDSEQRDTTSEHMTSVNQDSDSEQIGKVSEQRDTSSEHIDSAKQNIDSDSEQIGTVSEQSDTTSEHMDSAKQNIDSDSEQIGTVSKQSDTTSEHIDSAKHNIDSDSEQIGTVSEQSDTTSEHMTSVNQESDGEQIGTVSEQRDTTSEHMTSVNQDSCSEQIGTVSEQKDTTSEHMDSASEATNSANEEEGTATPLNKQSYNTEEQRHHGCELTDSEDYMPLAEISRRSKRLRSQKKSLNDQDKSDLKCKNSRKETKNIHGKSKKDSLDNQAYDSTLRFRRSRSSKRSSYPENSVHTKSDERKDLTEGVSRTRSRSSTGKKNVSKDRHSIVEARKKSSHKKGANKITVDDEDDDKDDDVDDDFQSRSRSSRSKLRNMKEKFSKSSSNKQKVKNRENSKHVNGSKQGSEHQEECWDSDTMSVDTRSRRSSRRCLLKATVVDSKSDRREDKGTTETEVQRMESRYRGDDSNVDKELLGDRLKFTDLSDNENSVALEILGNTEGNYREKSTEEDTDDYCNGSNDSAAVQKSVNGNSGFNKPQTKDSSNKSGHWTLKKKNDVLQKDSDFDHGNSDDSSNKISTPSKNDFSVLEKENLIGHFSPVLAGLHCSPLRNTKRQVLSPASSTKFLFVDDSDSDCCSNDGLLDKVNRSIKKFTDHSVEKDEEPEEELPSADEWPALSQAAQMPDCNKVANKSTMSLSSVGHSENTLPGRSRQLSGISNVSGLSVADTCSFTSFESDMSSVLSRLDTSETIFGEHSARTNLSVRLDENLTGPRRSKRRRESSTECSRNKRFRK